MLQCVKQLIQMSYAQQLVSIVADICCYLLACVLYILHRDAKALQDKIDKKAAAAAKTGGAAAGK
jgi:hypothetical protein